MRILSATVVALAVLSAGAASAQVAAGQNYTTSAYTIEPFTPATPITIQGSGVRLRAEPFAGQTPVLSSGSTGLQLNVVGIARQPDWDWYQVILKNGQRAFIRSDLTSAPSQGSTALPRPTVVASTPTTPQPQPHVYTPPPQPQPYVPPTYTPPVPIDPPPVVLTTPPAAQPQPPATNGRPSLDLPKPGDPPGLQSH